ncbi:hypothetical protein ACFQ7F_45540 [Streptomyces sp. NPDC056486]|uniref:hypothetical protein n=1 Tax=Streptomyces sp. NPDC056486 TaxID=3345835 RepID=UPI0036C38C76
MSPRNSIDDLDDDDLLNEGAGGVPEQSTGPDGLPVAAAPVTIAQGRPRAALTLADLPEPEEVEASGPLSAHEEELYNLCMRGVEEFKTAWWVLGKSVANMNSRRLYRKTHPSFAAWCKDTLGKSRASAYEEITAYALGELVSARADTPFEGNSNGVSARADTPAIGKKAASAYNTITKDYGPEVSVAVHETIKDATGKEASVKVIQGIVQQVPRKEDQELSETELTAMARELAATQAATQEAARLASQREREGEQAVTGTPAVDALRSALADLESAQRALTPAKIKRALAESSDEAAEILQDAKDAADKASKRVGTFLPE